MDSGNQKRPRTGNTGFVTKSRSHLLQSNGPTNALRTLALELGTPTGAFGLVRTSENRRAAAMALRGAFKHTQLLSLHALPAAFAIAFAQLLVAE